MVVIDEWTQWEEVSLQNQLGSSFESHVSGALLLTLWMGSLFMHLCVVGPLSY